MKTLPIWFGAKTPPVNPRADLGGAPIVARMKAFSPSEFGTSLIQLLQPLRHVRWRLECAGCPFGHGTQDEDKAPPSRLKGSESETPFYFSIVVGFPSKGESILRVNHPNKNRP